MANTDTSTNEENTSSDASNEGGSANVEFKDVENKEDSASDNQNQGEKSDDAANSDDTNASDKEQTDTSGDDTDKDQSSEKTDTKDEKGDVDIQLPEGSLIKDKAELLSILDGAGKSQEGFDKLGKYLSNMAEGLAKDNKKADDKAWVEAQSEWAKELKSDPSFGKDYDGNVKLATDTANDIDPEFGKLLAERGLDKHPTIAKAMAKVGKDRADAEVLMGGRNSDNDNNKDRNGNTIVTFKDVD